MSARPRTSAIHAAFVALTCWLTGADGAHAADEPPPLTSGPAAAHASAGDGAKAACVAQHQAAQVLRRERKLIAARAALRACAGAACPSAVRGDCIPWLDEVGRSLPSLVVTASAGDTDLVDVQVFLDGQLVTARLTGAAFEVDPGPHHLRLESPPWPPFERTILVSEGIKERAIDADLAPPPPPRELRTPPVLDYILGGAALGGFSAFAALGISALYDRRQLQQSCAPFCPQDEVSPVRMKLVLADAALGVAVTSLAVGLYLRAVRPPAPRPTGKHAGGGGLSASLAATPDGPRVGVAGVF